MAALRFKRFTSPRFFQSIHKPLFLRPFLEPHAEYFTEHGLDLATLTDTPECESSLLDIFSSIGDLAPPQLLAALYLVDDLADAPGMDQLVEECERRNISLAPLGDELTPGDLALYLYVKHQKAFRACYDRSQVDRISRFHEYQSRKRRHLNAKAARSACAAIEVALAPWMAHRHRGQYCGVRSFQEDREIKFLIVHGGPYETRGSIDDKRAQPSRVAYRPQRHDVLIYDNESGILKVNARVPVERDKYVEVFGDALFGDPGHFPVADLYRLDHLQNSNFSIAKTGDLANVALAELILRRDDDLNSTFVVRSADVLKLICRGQCPDIESGTLIFAKFRYQTHNDKRWRTVHVKPQNVADYDHERFAGVVERFLLANGILKTKEERSSDSQMRLGLAIDRTELPASRDSSRTRSAIRSTRGGGTLRG